MTIIPHNFNGKTIYQADNETDVNGATVPKGYVNLSQIARAGNKQLKNYWRLDGALTYVRALSESLKAETLTQKDAHICTSFCVRVSSPSLELGIKSGLLIPTPDASGAAGDLYCHFELAIEIARWISPEFNVWANRTLRLVINGEFKALTAEAAEAQARLKEVWEEIRSAGKVTRRTLTDAIKDWYQRNPGGTSCPQHAMYARTTDAIYQALWGLKAVEIEAKLDCDRHQLRNHLSADCLKVLDRAEDRVTEFIDLDNLKPINAVTEAKLRASRVSL